MQLAFYTFSTKPSNRPSTKLPDIRACPDRALPLIFFFANSHDPRFVLASTLDNRYYSDLPWSIPSTIFSSFQPSNLSTLGNNSHPQGATDRLITNPAMSRSVNMLTHLLILIFSVLNCLRECTAWTLCITSLTHI